jgi:vacuolar-type H+-ATPase subunit I/STV1
MEMVIEQEQKTVASSFAKRNTNKERIEQEEEEIAELEKENNKEDQQEEAEPTNAEEKTFKKRYGDLRRHAQEQENKLKRQVEELSKQLQQSTEKQIQLPKSEEELAAWAETYPDVAKIVETIAIKKAKEQSASIEERLRALDEREKETVRSKAEMELMKLHPDFDNIRNSDEFHSWVEEQPQWIQNALYDNDNDARSAARAIDLYKADKGIGKKKATDYKEAAKGIVTRGNRSTPDESNLEGVIYESQVAKMSSKQFEAAMEDIQKAQATGKFVYDLSGAAR